MRCLVAMACCLLTVSGFSNDGEETQEDLILSTPEQVATLTSEPSYLVGGLVSPLSGQLALRQTDMIVKGAQNIVLSRMYMPFYMPCSFPRHKHEQNEFYKRDLYYHIRKNYRGWQFFSHVRLDFNPRSMEVRFSEPSGMTLDFRLSGPKGSTTSLISPPYAISNMAGDIPSGKYDPRNTRISYEKEENKITVYATDGVTRIYRQRGWLVGYFLEKEILGNGKVLKYHYNDNQQLHYIESLDPKERYVYSSLRIAGTPKGGNCHFTSSSGLMADYNYQKRHIDWKIKKEKSKEKDYKASKGNVDSPPMLTSVSSPLYRNESLDYCGSFLFSSYSGKNDVFNAEHAGFGEGFQHHRVHKLLLPVGQNDAFEPVYEISYQPPLAGEREGTTTVKNSDGTSIIYHFSKNLLTTLIQYFGQDGSLKKENLYAWDDQNWLKSLEMRDGQKNLFYRKTYEYDDFGNPTLETFEGDLTGEGEQETFTTKRIFSEDGRNLLLREETEDGKVICFSHLPGTNLITSKLTKDGNTIILREFSVYDDCYNLIQTISDDGEGEDKDNLSGVTQRLLKTYTLRQSAPFLHMPEWVQETYLENGTEKLLKKSHLVYDQHGNVSEEEIYGAEGYLAYTICKTYNERGDVLTETNRLGQEAVYTYDARGRLETATNFSDRLHKTFSHDTKGRLRKVVEKGDDGIIHVTSSKYDFHDRKILKIDPFSNSIQYTYDPLVSEIIKTDFPEISSIDGRAIPVATASSYDPFGRELTKTDANGNVTTYRYNVYGSKSEILHPNGGKELFRYAKNGDLISYTDSDGLTINYKNDVLGRVLSKTYTSVEGETLAKETYTYNGFNLLTHTDKEGNLKQYSYDGAGRKIQEAFCGQVTDFSYDSLGRLATICKHNVGNTLLVRYERDLEGKILEERKTDSSGRTLYRINYSYDKDGNRQTVTRHVNGKESVDTFAYDSFCRLIEEKDALGYITQMLYNENYTNTLGQKVLQVVKTDPLHIVTVETKDALSRTIKKEILDSQKGTLACQEMTHDPQGNLLYRRDHVYEDGHFQSLQIIKYTYTSEGRVDSLTRALGTKESRTTSYTYSLSGKTTSKTLPDGITLLYDYHPLGFMSRIDSSDGKIRHAFGYDLLGNLKYAIDENQSIIIKRQVDPFGNVIQETFPYGFEVKKDYDDFNRIVSLKMDSQGEVLYTYDPLFLRGITRTSPRGEVLYQHAYEEYDENGNLVSERLIGNLGRITHETDLRGQKASIMSPYFSQECGYDAAGNLISNITDKAEHRYSYDGLSQLSSEGSVSQSLTYAHDSLYNRTQKNRDALTVNGLNELLSFGNTKCSYDLNGNLDLRQNLAETFQFSYDPLNRLIEATSEKQKIKFVYDPLGRALSKTIFTKAAPGWSEASHEYYLYHGVNEIGAFTSPGMPTNLRVLGLTQCKDSPVTVGIEIEGQLFAPIMDVQGNIRRLIDLDSKTITNRYDFTAFGEEMEATTLSTSFNPWRFASKRFDPQLGLVYFGRRHYDPLLGRWLTTDPAGFTDSVNLYQYVFNNPFRYSDPDGRFVVEISLLALTWKVLAVAVAAAYVNYELEHQHRHSDSAFARAFNSAAHQVVQNLGGVSQYMMNQLSMEKKKNIDELLPASPEELLKDPKWEETSHPKAKENGHREFENKETGEKLRYDEAKPGESGHKAEAHWHRYNPDITNTQKEYLDVNGNPVRKNSDESHLYPPNGIV